MVIYAIAAITPDLGPDTNEQSKRAGICQLLAISITFGGVSIIGINKPDGSIPPTRIITRPASAPLKIANALTIGLQLSLS